MTTLVTSPEFWSREAYRAKIKTPFEVVASAVRALDGRLVDGGGPRGGAAGGGAWSWPARWAGSDSRSTRRSRRPAIPIGPSRG